jgi:hypothetical protein
MILMMADKITGHRATRRIRSEEFSITKVYGTGSAAFGDERAVSTTATISAEFNDYKFKEGNELYPNHFTRVEFEGSCWGIGDLESEAERIVLERFGEYVETTLHVNSESAAIGWNTYNNKFDADKTYGEAILKFLSQVNLE